MSRPRPFPQHRARLAFRIGVVVLVLCFVGAFFDRRQFFQSYLFAHLFFSSISLGALALFMLHQLVGGGWGWLIRRPLEAAMSAIPVLALLFIPVLLGLHDLYAWARPDVVAADPTLRHKQPYLNLPFFIGRAVAYFILWIALAYLFGRWSALELRMGSATLRAREVRLSAAGLIVYGITVTFAAVDWVMSLDPRWQSTAFGVLYALGQMLAGLDWAIIAAAMMAANVQADNRAAGPISGLFNDLGNLLLAFVLGWIYVAFMQYLVIWSGDLPKYIVWYLERSRGGWQWLIGLVLLLQVALPFAALLSRAVKRSPRMLAWVAASVLLGHLIYVFWLVAPALYPVGVHLHWLDIAALVAIGGIWFAAFLWRLQDRVPLTIPASELEEPRLG